MKIPEHVAWQSTGRTLGSGGQGEVQVVRRRDQPRGPQYALKVLRNADSSQARQRFRREIEVVERLDSPFIVRVVDYSGEEDDFQYYVMEYHEGAKTLAKIILSIENPFHGNIKRSLDLFENIVSAIAVCEQAIPPIVHRDINPQNILLLPDNTIRLIDFGVCQTSYGQLITLVDENVGARNYTSPECEAGNDEIIDVRSDIYSAAKVLWAAITSRQAFAREEPAFGDRSLETLFPELPQTWHLTQVFQYTIRRNPADRCRNSGELLQLIGNVRRIVQGGFPPLNKIASYCPSCGWQTTNEYRDGHIVFGNPNPRGVRSLICEICGFIFARNTENLWKNIDQLKTLD